MTAPTLLHYGLPQTHPRWGRVFTARCCQHFYGQGATTTDWARVTCKNCRRLGPYRRRPVWAWGKL
jgi:hypothetical protein